MCRAFWHMMCAVRNCICILMISLRAVEMRIIDCDISPPHEHQGRTCCVYSRYLHIASSDNISLVLVKQSCRAVFAQLIHISFTVVVGGMG